MSGINKSVLEGTAVKQLADLVQYQSGSIISRVTEEQRRSQRTYSPFDALVNVIEGEADIDIASQTFRVRQGEILTLPANRPHAVKAVSNFKMLLTMIRGQSSDDGA